MDRVTENGLCDELSGFPVALPLPLQEENRRVEENSLPFGSYLYPCGDVFYCLKQPLPDTEKRNKKKGRGEKSEIVR